MVRNTWQNLQDYLDETLGIALPLDEWHEARALPYAIRDPYEFRQSHMLGRRIVLMLSAGQRDTSLAQLAVHARKVENTADCPVVFVTSALDFFERRALVQQHVPFIVPKTHLYLPDLGIDFRERARRSAALVVTQLAPATQAVLLAHMLFGQWEHDWMPARDAKERGYSAITASRVARELAATALFEARESKSRVLRPMHPARKTWELMRPFLRTPVRERRWVLEHEAEALRRAPLAGLSALAELTMLGAPTWPVYAVTAEQARGLAGRRVERTVAGRPLSDGPVYEVWRYPPISPPGHHATVDPLSLILSLGDEADPRIVGALEELAGRLPW